MIVADTSAWIANIRDLSSLPVVRKLRDPDVQSEVILGDIILCEVLNGARSDRDASILEAHLRSFRIVTMGGDTLAVQAARHYRRMRAVGFTMSKLPDLYIGTWCIMHDHRLLHCDSDYDAMVRHCGLNVF